jgi:hypothetical protein
MEMKEVKARVKELEGAGGGERAERADAARRALVDQAQALRAGWVLTPSWPPPGPSSPPPDYDDNKPVWPTWAAGALFRSLRRIHINYVCFHISLLAPSCSPHGLLMAPSWPPPAPPATVIQDLPRPCAPSGNPLWPPAVPPTIVIRDPTRPRPCAPSGTPSWPRSGPLMGISWPHPGPLLTPSSPPHVPLISISWSPSWPPPAPPATVK